MYANCRFFFQHHVSALDALKHERNPVKDAALVAIDRKAEERKQKEQESRRKAREMEAKVQAWKEDVADPVEGRGSMFSEALEDGL